MCVEHEAAVTLTRSSCLQSPIILGLEWTCGAETGGLEGLWQHQKCNNRILLTHTYSKNWVIFGLGAHIVVKILLKLVNMEETLQL